MEGPAKDYSGVLSITGRSDKMCRLHFSSCLHARLTKVEALCRQSLIMELEWVGLTFLIASTLSVYACQQAQNRSVNGLVYAQVFWKCYICLHH